MENHLLRWAIIIVVLAHGIGHIMGFMAAWTNVPMGFTDRPSLLGDTLTLESAVGRAFGLLWLVAMIAFLGSVYGLAAHQDWWRVLMIAAAFISLVAILPWWNTVTPGPRFGATLVDVIIIAALLPSWGEQIVRAIGSQTS
jgi:cytochrome c biogenesis protein CcdA